MKTIAVVCPTERDVRELNRLESRSKYHYNFYGDNPRNYLHKFDALLFLKRALEDLEKKEIDGVMGTHDYPGSIISAILSKDIGLPGVEPEKVLLCQHKYYSRQAQLRSVPEAVPEFKLINPYESNLKVPFDFPFFIKPVKSFFSIFASRVNNSEEFRKFVELSKNHLSRFVVPLNQLLEKHSRFELNANYLIAEKLLEGCQVTVEGYSYNDKIEIIGIVDSIMYPKTISFQRFDYPSKLDGEIQKRMIDIAKKIIRDINFDGGLFNIEMIYNPITNAIHIIEINPRMCSQFADIMEKVNGVNTYEIQLALSLGKEPISKENAGKYKTAASFVLRTFKDKEIKKLPSKQELDSFKKKNPDARVEIFGKKGARLSNGLQDMGSFRYCVINLGGRDKQDLFNRFRESTKYLRFEFSG